MIESGTIGDKLLTMFVEHDKNLAYRETVLMGHQAAIHKEKYSWDDYRHWDDDHRWELIEGEAYGMSPAPIVRHQRLIRNLTAELIRPLKGTKCELLLAPTDVKLSEDDIVQPDLLIVCDPAKIKETHIEGAPTLVVEVLSPSSISHDRLRKTHLYARYGVKEYWIVSPYPSLIEVLLLDGESYRLHRVFGKHDRLTSPTFPELKVNLEAIFDFEIPEAERIDEIREGTPPYR